ncbi:MAG: DUF2892 domain-containing protein [Bdellovibrionales bacterium]|nr:DUF2892 domain-containing protein [Bdellovibrionales bacterium]
MSCNIYWWDRIIRFVVGVLLTSYAIAGGPIWAYGGILIIATSSWGFCPIYWGLKINHKKTTN